MRERLLAIRDELKRRRHESVQIVGQWLNRVVTGYFNYHPVPGNLLCPDGFRVAVCRLWRKALKRRNQRNRLQWSRYGRPSSPIYQGPEPLILRVTNLRQEPYAVVPHVRICAGGAGELLSLPRP